MRVFDLDPCIRRAIHLRVRDTNTNNTKNTRKRILGKEKEEERPIVQTLFTVVVCLLKPSKIIQK